MATAQSFLTKNGMRSGLLGSAAALALAFPLAAGDYDVAAHTDATRIGWFAERGATPAIGTVVNGTQILSTKADSLAVLSVKAATSTTDAAFTVAGGVGVGGDLNVGSEITAAGEYHQLGTDVDSEANTWAINPFMQPSLYGTFSQPTVFAQGGAGSNKVHSALFGRSTNRPLAVCVSIGVTGLASYSDTFNARPGDRIGVYGQAESLAGEGADGYIRVGVHGYGYSSDAFTANTVYGMRARGECAAAANGALTYGIDAVAVGAATSATAYGIYATASGATTNWAGYFDGNVTITGGDGTQALSILRASQPPMRFRQSNDAAYLQFFDTADTTQVAGIGYEETADKIFLGHGNNIAGPLAAGLVINADNTVTVQDTTASTSATTGALVVAGGVGISGTVTIAQGTITAATPHINTTTTWNNGAVIFSGWKMDVTDTASSSLSRLIDLQVNSGALFWITPRATARLTGRNACYQASQGTITAECPVFQATATWNSGVTGFKGIEYIVTDTSSMAKSELMRLAIDSDDIFAVLKGVPVSVTASEVKVGGGTIKVGNDVHCIDVHCNAIKIDQGTITAAAPHINTTATWNNAGVTFKAIQCDVAVTAASVNSKLIDLLVGSTTKFTVDINGNAYFAGGISADVYDTATASNLLLRRNGTTKITVGSSEVTFADTVSADTLDTATSTDLVLKRDGTTKITVGSSEVTFADDVHCGAINFGDDDLDEYDKISSWTPAAADAGGGATFTTTVLSAKYTEVGDEITIHCDITITSVSGSASGHLRITGLPSAVGTGLQAHGIGIVTGFTTAGPYLLIAWAGQSYLSVYSDSISPINASEVSGDERLVFSMTYTRN